MLLVAIAHQVLITETELCARKTNNMETLYREQNGTYMFRAAMALLEVGYGC